MYVPVLMCKMLMFVSCWVLQSGRLQLPIQLSGKLWVSGLCSGIISLLNAEMLYVDVKKNKTTITLNSID